MKKKLSICFFMALLGVAIVSCSDDDNTSIDLSPYASLRAFSIDNLKAYNTIVASDGSDSVAVSTVYGSAYSFVIDQKNFQVYNSDSLPVGTDVKKVKVEIESDGFIYLYDDVLQDFLPYNSADSINFTSPRRFMIESTDGKIKREYSVRLDVRKINPDNFYWQSADVPAVYEPLRMLQLGDDMILWGKNIDGELVCSKKHLTVNSVWSEALSISTLPQSADLKSVQLFGSFLYAVAEDELYVSTDGISWNKSIAEGDFGAVFAASDAAGKMWAVLDGNLSYTTEGDAFTSVEPFPEEFPLKNISSVAYPLKTNSDIIRSVLVGNKSADARPTVWSVLATEKAWTQYSYPYDKYQCPALENLSVLYYDDKLFAIGGTGTYEGEPVEAFQKFFVSKNNGVVWLPSARNIFPPVELKGYDAPFAAIVDNDGWMWIVVGGDSPSAWCGGLNRLLD